MEENQILYLGLDYACILNKYALQKCTFLAEQPAFYDTHIFKWKEKKGKMTDHFTKSASPSKNLYLIFKLQNTQQKLQQK